MEEIEKYEEVVVENPTEDEEIDVDMTEISLGEDEINDQISQLEELRETKNPIEIELDENNELLITYDPDADEEDEDNKEDEESEDENELGDEE